MCGHVVMQSIVFDDSGEMWDAKSYRLVEMLQASLYGEELLNYAVKNLGFVCRQRQQRLVAHPRETERRFADGL